MLLMALLALSFVAAPLIRNAWASSPGFTNVPLLTVLATLLLAFGLYAAIGRPDVATGELANNSLDMVAQKRPATNSDAKAASVSKLLAGLEQRLQEDPGNAKDWLLLAKTYEDYVEALREGFRLFHQDHIDVYGAGNERRLTGSHETASIDEFSFGASNRGASIRIPLYTTTHDWKGYLEDRRRASDADPYLVVDRIMRTVKVAHEEALKAV